jgi:hypothetical protein
VVAGIHPAFPERFTYMSLPAQDTDSYDIIAQLPACFAFIDQALTQGGGERASLVLAAHSGAAATALLLLPNNVWQQIGLPSSPCGSAAIRGWLGWTMPMFTLSS